MSTHPGHQTTTRVGPAARRVRRRPTLPSSRAAIGGLLVAVAALGTWWAAAGRSAPPVTYLVAAHSLGPGHRLTADDLRARPIALPPGAANQAYAASGDLPIGRVLAGPVAAGELLQHGTLAPAQQPASLLASIAVDPAWAVAGTIRAGDHVDLLATYGERDDARTTQVLRNGVVAEVDARSSGAIGQESGQVLTLRFRRPDDLLAAVTAARAGAITVVRTDGHTRTPLVTTARVGRAASSTSGAGS